MTIKFSRRLLVNVMQNLRKKNKSIDDHKVRVDEKLPHKNCVSYHNQVYFELITKNQIFKLRRSQTSVSVKLKPPNQNKHSIVP